MTSFSLPLSSFNKFKGEKGDIGLSGPTGHPGLRVSKYKLIIIIIYLFFRVYKETGDLLEEMGVLEYQ